MSKVISLEYKPRTAIITIDNPTKLNALNQRNYYDIAHCLEEVAKRDDVYVTILIGKGRYFSSGADVSGNGLDTFDKSHKNLLNSFVVNNLYVTRAFYTHPKILVAALNGPVVGLSASIVAMADFIYCTPQTFLLTPFSSIGLVTEGGASRALVQRLGIAKANEALIMSRRIPAPELLSSGFVNAVFDVGGGEGADARFRKRVVEEVEEWMGPHLTGDSLTGIKRLIRKPELEIMDRQNVEEVFAGLERFMTGVPQEEFAKIARGEKRHKI